MKDYLIFGIFMYILKKGKTSAREIAEEFEIVPRTVYRYIDAMSIAGIAIYTQRGRNGGILVPENYKVENVVLSKEQKQILASVLNVNIPDEAKKIISQLCA